MRAKLNLILLLLVALMLSGCMLTVDQMYCLPKRSETYNNLQSAIDEAMEDLSYCAPLSGENQQSVQMADLDGDGKNEYLLFAKSSQEEKPLRILVFQNDDGIIQQTNIFECSGSAFDQVEYVDLDKKGGVEIIVGRQVSDQVTRTASIYTLSDGEMMQLLTVNYTKFLTADLDNDGLRELFVLRPGQSDTDNGIAELYSMRSGTIERYNEVGMSRPADQLKRIIIGKIHGGQAAIYTASAAGDNALVTDVYILRGERFANISLSDGSDTSVQTLRSFYIYATDIDKDTVVELPRLIAMQGKVPGEINTTDQLICWYAVTADGGQVEKLHTYHNFVGGWYMQLNEDWAERVSVVNAGNAYAFHIWNRAGTGSKKVVTVYALSAQNRESFAETKGFVELYKTDTVIYAAVLEECAAEYDLDENTVKNSFHLIQQEWKTGET